MSGTEKRMAGDLLFWFQFITACISAGAQIVRSLTSTVGMSITWPLFTAAFVIINLFLAHGAHRQSHSRKAFQLMIVYLAFSILWSFLTVIVLAKGTWAANDTFVTMVTFIGFVILLVVRRQESFLKTVSEPITRGIIALLLKGVSQIFMTYCIIAAHKATGVSGVSLFCGHVIISTRLAEIVLAARQDGWSKQNIGLFIGETGNEITWIAVTLAWFWVS